MQANNHRRVLPIGKGVKVGDGGIIYAITPDVGSGVCIDADAQGRVKTNDGGLEFLCCGCGEGRELVPGTGTQPKRPSPTCLEGLLATLIVGTP